MGDADAASVTSFEETYDERKARLARRALALRREKDKQLLRMQAARRREREKRLKDAIEKEEKLRFFVANPPEGVTRARPAEEILELGIQETETRMQYPAVKTPVLWGEWVHRRLGEQYNDDPTVVHPAFLGYRTPDQPEGPIRTMFRLPLRDPRLLKDYCIICAGDIPGCPACWVPKGKAAMFSYHGSDVAFTREGKTDDNHASSASWSADVVKHTKQRDYVSIQKHRRDAIYVTVYVKALPFGNLIKLNLEGTDTVRYLYNQFRANSGVIGYQDKLDMLMPTEGGLVRVSEAKWRGTEWQAGFDHGARTLSSFKITIPGRSITLISMPIVKDTIVLPMITSFYRCNFTPLRPWTVKILDHVDFLPARFPDDDDTQTTMGTYMREQFDNVAEWARKDEARLMAIQEVSRKKAEETRKKMEMEAIKARNKAWKKARVREARERIEAAMLMRANIARGIVATLVDNRSKGGLAATKSAASLPPLNSGRTVGSAGGSVHSGRGPIRAGSTMESGFAHPSGTLGESTVVDSRARRRSGGQRSVGGGGGSVRSAHSRHSRASR